jgi:hypothetical protein
LRSVDILPSEPPIEGLLQVVQVLWLPMTLAFAGARIPLRQPLVSIQPAVLLKPPIITAERRNGIISGGI